MKKIQEKTENEIIEMTKNNFSAREISKKFGICHRTVLQVRKRRNVSAPEPKKSRPRLLTDRDARAMERLMITMPKTTAKEAAIAIKKPVSE